MLQVLRVTVARQHQKRIVRPGHQSAATHGPAATVAVGRSLTRLLLLKHGHQIFQFPLVGHAHQHAAHFHLRSRKEIHPVGQSQPTLFRILHQLVHQGIRTALQARFHHLPHRLLHLVIQVTLLCHLHQVEREHCSRILWQRIGVCIVFPAGRQQESHTQGQASHPFPCLFHNDFI